MYALHLFRSKAHIQWLKVSIALRGLGNLWGLQSNKRGDHRPQKVLTGIDEIRTLRQALKRQSVRPYLQLCGSDLSQW